MKYFKSLILTALLLPNLAFGATVVGWNTPTITTGWIAATLVNGVNQAINAVAGIFTSASSTFGGDVHLPALSAGCLQLSGGVITSTGLACATGSGSTFPFTVTGYGVSTSTTIGFLNGLLSTASTTINASTTITGQLTLGGATTTSASGFNISTGCFAINGVCLSSGGSGTVTNIATTFPILGGPITTTGTLTFGGLSTSSPIGAGAAALYATGVNTIASISTSTPTVTAPITYSGTLGNLIGGASGAFGCTSASSGVTGCLTGTDWTTFNNKQATISVTWPITLSGATVGFNGLSTSTSAVIGNIPYFSGVNTFANVATGTVTCTGTASCGTGSYVIGSSLTITGSASGASGFTTDTTYATTTAATSTSIWTQGAYFASSSGATSTFDGGLWAAFKGGTLNIGTLGAGQKNGKLNVGGGTGTGIVTAATRDFDTPSGENMQFGTAGTLRGLFDTSGNFGVASATPNYTLSIGTTQTSFFVTNGAASGKSFNLYTPTAGDDSNYAFTQDSNNILTLARTDSAGDNGFSLLEVDAPILNPRESTLTLKRSTTTPATCSTFLDVYNDAYLSGTQQYGLRVQKRGGCGGIMDYQPLVFDFYDGTIITPALYIATSSSNTTIGNVGIGTTSPNAKVSIAPLNGVTPFLVSTSTGAATGTAFIIDTNGKVGIGTTSPSNTLGILGGWFTTASSTGMNGINLSNGCYAINGTCISTGGGTVTSVTGTWPIISSGGATPNITFGGLSTSSPIAAGAAVLYATGVNTMASAATGTITCTGSASCGSGSYVIGSNLTITGGATFDSKWATSTGAWSNAITPNGGTNTLVGIGTATPMYSLDVASSSGAQLALTDGVGISKWTVRNTGSNLFFSTTTIAGTATATKAALTINKNGLVGISSTTPMDQLSIEGTSTSAFVNVVHAGKFGCGTGGLLNYGLQGTEYCGSDNSDTGGVQILTDNNSNGASAWGGFTVNNDLADNTFTHFFGMYLNSSAYTSTFFGTAIGKKNLGIIQNTDGELDLIASLGTEANNPAGIGFITGGTATENTRGKLTYNGLWGFGTTTPTAWTTTIASSTAPQLSLSAGAGFGQWVMRNAGGLFALATTSVAGTATSSVSAFSINANGIPRFPALASGGSCLSTDSNGLLGLSACSGGGGSNTDKWATSTVSGIYPNTADKVGIGSTSPFAMLSIHATSTTGSNGLSTLFAVASSTGGAATTTLFSVANTGQVSLNLSSATTTLVTLGSESLIVDNLSQTSFGVGRSALSKLTSGGDNTAFGYNALAVLTGGTDNVAIGSYAMWNMANGNTNIAIGGSALQNHTGGSSNIALGVIAMEGAGIVTTGNKNIAIGEGSLFNIASQNNNIAIGYKSGNSLNAGDANILIGVNVDAPSNTDAQLNIGNVLYGTGLYNNQSTLSSSPTGAGKIGIGTTSPFSTLQLATSTVSSTFKPQLVITDSGASTNLKHWTFASEGGNFYISTSTDLYATTSISALEISGTGFGTTTLRGLNISGSATSTSNVGYNITTGCYAINKACVGGGSFSNTLANGGTATTTFYNGGVVFSDATKLTQSAAAANFFWDETNKRLGIGDASPLAALTVGNGDLFQVDTTGRMYVPNGTGALPSISFVADTSYGFNFNPGGGTIRVSIGGSTAATFGSSAITSLNDLISSNVVQAPGNSASTPAYTFSSDLNNGMFSPASDITAFATAGVERVRIDASGLVGIGSTTPYALLSVAGAGGTTNLFAVSTTTTQGLPNFAIDSVGHVITSGEKPSVVTCGTSPSVTGNDNAGKITTGTASPTACVYNFANAWGTAPACVVTGGGPSGTKLGAYLIATTTTTQISIMASSSAATTFTTMTSWTIMYICQGTQ